MNHMGTVKMNASLASRGLARSCQNGAESLERAVDLFLAAPVVKGHAAPSAITSTKRKAARAGNQEKSDQKKSKRRIRTCKYCAKAKPCASDGTKCTGCGKTLRLASGRKPRTRWLCAHPGCKKGAVGGYDHCVAHGGGKRRGDPGCKHGAVGGYDHCGAHGGGKRCGYPHCKHGAVGGSDHCIAHGRFDPDVMRHALAMDTAGNEEAEEALQAAARADPEASYHLMRVLGHVCAICKIRFRTAKGLETHLGHQHNPQIAALQARLGDLKDNKDAHDTLLVSVATDPAYSTDLKWYVARVGGEPRSRRDGRDLLPPRALDDAPQVILDSGTGVRWPAAAGLARLTSSAT